MKNVKVKGIMLLLCTTLFSLSISSQVSRKQVTKTKTQTTSNRQSSTNLVVANTSTPFWKEDFGLADQKTGDHGILAEKAKLNNGPWTQTRLDPAGQKNNNWYVSAMEGGVGVGSCSMGFDKDHNILDNTLHIGYDYRIGDKGLDMGAIYAKNESSATDLRVESPLIDCSGKSNITLNFNYFTGGIVGVDGASLYYHDGTNWSLITTFGPSVNDSSCIINDQSTWRTSDTYVLPSSADNNPEVRIAFRWKNEPSVAGNSEIYSIAIDDVVLSDNTSSIPTPTNDPSSSSLRTVKSTKNVVVAPPVVRNVEFTVYPNPNSGQFTIDFAGIENNHEVQIVLSDLQTGKQLYTTTFFSSTIEHNKIDVNPTEKIAPGRYSCSLICEGIRLTKQVVIN